MNSLLLKSRFFQLAWGNDPEQAAVAGDVAQLAILTCTSIRFVHPPLVLTPEECQDLRWLLDQPLPATEVKEISLWGTVFRPSSTGEGVRFHYWLPLGEWGLQVPRGEKKPVAPAIFQLHRYLKTLYPPEQALVFFRVGDFCETYAEDARTAARVLDIVLASRPVEDNQRTPLAGFPVFSADGYIKKLNQAGYLVVKCERVDAPHAGGVTAPVPPA